MVEVTDKLLIALKKFVLNEIESRQFRYRFVDCFPNGELPILSKKHHLDHTSHTIEFDVPCNQDGVYSVLRQHITLVVERNYTNRRWKEVGDVFVADGFSLRYVDHVGNIYNES